MTELQQTDCDISRIFQYLVGISRYQTSDIGSENDQISSSLIETHHWWPSGRFHQSVVQLIIYEMFQSAYLAMMSRSSL